MQHHTTRPLYHQRGGNPPRLIGYQCTEHGEIYTANMRPSQPTRIVQGGQYAAPRRVVDSKAHARRVAAL